MKDVARRKGAQQGHRSVEETGPKGQNRKTRSGDALNINQMY